MSWHGDETLFRHGKNVVNMIMNDQSGGFHGACLHPLHDFLVRNIEDGCPICSLSSSLACANKNSTRALCCMYFGESSCRFSRTMMRGAFARSKRPGSPRRSCSAKNSAVHSL